MSLGQLLAVGGTMASILGVFLTIYGVINNRTVKETARYIGDLITTMDREHREILLRIDQGQAEARKEMAEAIKYLADLIRVESEKTRQAFSERPV